MNENTGFLRRNMLVCPACKTDISGRLSYELTPIKDVDMESDVIETSLHITGMDIKHKCPSDSFTR